MFTRVWVALLLFPFFGGAQTAGNTVVGIRGSQFTINGQPSYTPASGFPAANANLAGTLLNVRAVQAIFDDANYPNQGSRLHPYQSNTLGPIFWDYPDGPWDPERNVREFLAALPDWRRCGLLAFTVNLQGGGPPDGNYGERITLQPHNNSGFDPQGNLKPAYAGRLRRVIAEADRLGMVAIVGFFYFGSNERIQVTPDDRYVKEAIVQGCRFLKGLPHRNILIEINNETSASGYQHRILQPNGALDAVLLAQQTVERQIPVSMSWSGGILPRGSRGEAAMRAVDYVMFHTNGQTPEEVHQSIQAMRRWVGYDRPVIINEDGVSTFNLHAAVQEHVGWGYYDNGLSNYRDGFQAPPVNWKINTPVKWQFFEQVARLTGSPIPPRPEYSAGDAPEIELLGLQPGQVLKERAWIEAVVKDRHPRWPIKRVEFFIDGAPYSFRRNAPFLLNNQEWWDMVDVAAGPHVLRVVAYDQRGPRFTELGSMLEVPFSVVSGESPAQSPVPSPIPAGKLAPRPLYRDPPFDAPTDPVLCFNAERNKWFMYYTARRASAADAPGVTWIHGSNIGMAESPDGGATWTYLGVADIRYGKDTHPNDYTYWAPEVIWHDGTYHMFLSFVPGIFTDWNHPREIVHLTSQDGVKWDTDGPLDLKSDRVIDACVIQLPDGTWRMWYKDERKPRALSYADSPDLFHWEAKGNAITDRNGEGPKVIHWQGKYWLIADTWATGMRVWSSYDCLRWMPQDETLIGSHGDVVISGGRAWWFYFGGPQPFGPRRRSTAINVVELSVADGKLIAGDPARPTWIDLKPVREAEN